jgi:DNA-binding PadR family transcriptional regulator
MRRGALRFALLKLLAAGERHGYDLLKEMRWRGWGMPGPASVYPVLTMLEEAGLVSSREEGGRRIYQLTATGREFLRDRADFVDKMLADLAQPSSEADGDDDDQALRRSMERLMRAASQVDADSKPEMRAKVQEIVDRARKEIYTLLSDE